MNKAADSAGSPRGDSDKTNQRPEDHTGNFSEFYNYYFDSENGTKVELDISKLIWRLITLEAELRQALKEKAEAVFRTNPQDQ